MDSRTIEFTQIREFLKLERQLELNAHTISRFEELHRDTTDLLAKKQELLDALLQYTAALAGPVENSTVSSRYANLKRQLQVIRGRLVPNDRGEAIDRNQGLMWENRIYNIVLDDLNDVLSNEFMGISLPYYKYSAGTDFDSEPLKTLLAEILAELSFSAEPANFIELHELIRNLEQRIIAVAKAEYDRNRDKSQIFF